MKYLILIHHTKEALDVWAGFSEAEKAEGWAAYGAINDELAASGEMLANGPLANAGEGKRVTAGPSGVTATDGPFAEIKEQLGGFYYVDVETPERAIEIAGRIPEAQMGLVEVRPVLEPGVMDF